MIYLITGLPGNGKTLYALSWVEAKAKKEGRPVFYARIKGLKLPWTLIDPFEWFKCPPNSIVVIDECQQSADPSDPKSPSLFGVRQRGAPVPQWAAELETHRHKGIDLVLITQDPMLLDSHDRKLTHLHFHIKRTFGMQRATVHEFSGCRPQAATSQTGSIRHEWRYPAEVYGWYESAEVHTVKARVPFRVWLFLALPFVILGVVWYAWSRYLDPTKGKKPTSEQPGSSARLVGGGGANGTAPKTTAQYLDGYVPRVAGLAYTAPVYDTITAPVRAPYPAACLVAPHHDPQRASEYGRTIAGCQCYTQQGTKLATTQQMCQDLAAGGFFVAWDEPVRQAVPLPPPSPAPKDTAPLPGAVSLGTTATAVAK